MPSTKQFDVDEALDRAMETFWEKGYAATSMCNLLEGMGIQKGSFYATYESKHQVFLDALRRYAGRRLGEVEAALRGLAPRKAIEKMFEMTADECACGQRDRGCMVVNTALELAPTDEEVGRLVRQSMKRHEKLLAERVREGQRSGEIGAQDDPAHIARALLGLTLAMRVFARAGFGPSHAAALRAQADRLLDPPG